MDRLVICLVKNLTNIEKQENTLSVNVKLVIIVAPKNYGLRLFTRLILKPLVNMNIYTFKYINILTKFKNSRPPF